MQAFKDFLENLWGEIPSDEKRPSDGHKNSDKLSMSSNRKGGAGAPPMMMDKKGKTKKKKS